MIGLVGTVRCVQDVEPVKTEEFYPYGRPTAIRALLPFWRMLLEEYAIKNILIRWLVRLRWTAERQQRIDYLDGWIRVVDRAIAQTRGYFRHPAF